MSVRMDMMMGMTMTMRIHIDMSVIISSISISIGICISTQHYLPTALWGYTAVRRTKGTAGTGRLVRTAGQMTGRTAAGWYPPLANYYYLAPLIGNRTGTDHLCSDCHPPHYPPHRS
jgi:hypothetical protein